MTEPVLDTDYLVIGTGATAMAFVDTLLAERPDATVVMVDRHDRPGGHWNHAYPFVRLHQPAAWYGVASRELGNDGAKDAAGVNAGMCSLASGAEVLAYFERTMHERFLPSRRVRWLPMSEYARGPGGEHLAVSLVGGQVTRIAPRRLVDARHARTEVPATHPPRYAVADGVRCVPLNALPSLSRPHAAYTVVGGGKTGMDACLWLLEHDVPPERIRWVVPRDAWFLDRGNYQPGLAHFERNMTHLARQFDAIVAAESVQDLYARLEAAGALLRLDPAVMPTAYRCATVSHGELAQLRRIRDVVRLGRVRAVEPGRLVLAHGALDAPADTLYVDCSSSAIQPPPDLPVFDGDTINLFMVRTCQPTFSAAVIAYVESHVDDLPQKNAMCARVPSPESPIDWLRMWVVTLENLSQWRQHAGMSAWLAQCRLNANAVMMRGVTPDDEARIALAKAIGPKSGAALPKLKQLLAGAA